MDEAMDVYDLAKVLRCSPTAVYKMRSRGQIPFRKKGRRLLFLRSEIEAYLRKLPGVTLDEIATGDGRR